MQLEDDERGFSFMREGPLDMRMGDEDLTAEEIVNRWPQQQLEQIFRELGEEWAYRKIAKGICERRRKKLFTTTKDLASFIETLKPRRGKIHPATQVFQALRMAVNDELTAIQEALEAALGALASGGRIAVISFHSLEDRLVKNCLRDWCKEHKEYQLCTKKPIVPSVEEIRKNKRSRSSKLRVVERL